MANVSTVPQRSPFRYPGGKTWLVPEIRRWLSSRPKRLLEPFAGGGIVSLTALSEELVDEAILVELDSDVASVWKTIAKGDGPKLADMIVGFDLTKENVAAELKVKPRSDLRRAFQTIIKNRVNRGGILAPGVGMIKSGENNQGLKSRWYPDTLKKRILAIDGYRNKMKAVEGDAFPLIEKYLDSKDTAIFIDPPYTAPGGKRSGSRLYLHSQIDHERLFNLAGKVKGPLLMTYDDNPEVIEMAKKNGLSFKKIPMKTTHHQVKNELLISKDLSWARKRY